MKLKPCLNMHDDSLTIVVCCNKKDFYLAKICIASVRYYYPDINIEHIKDPGNGHFNTLEIEKVFQVKTLDFGDKKLGWGAAKFFYLYQLKKDKKVFFLDADIVFISPFLERLEVYYKNNDFVVSADFNVDPYSDWAKNTYFNTRDVEKNYNDYTFPSYFFNTGQIFMTGGTIDKELMNEFFDKENYPYWKNLQLFPLVDQSVLNYLLATLVDKKKITLHTDRFMIWGGGDEIFKYPLNDIKEKSLEVGLIHWAGCLRIPYLKKIRRGDILQFFENYYYSKIPSGSLKSIKNKIIASLDYSLRVLYRRTLKKLVKNSLFKN